MKSIVIHDGPMDHAFALSSLVAGLRRKYGYHPITWVTSARNGLFCRYMKDVEVLDIAHDKLDASRGTYDVAVSYGGSPTALMATENVVAERYYGVYLNDWQSIGENLSDTRNSYSILYEGQTTKQNLFQVLYQMADLTWRGESYGFKYFPRAKERGDLLGVAIRDEKLRSFIKGNLEVTERKLWHVPIKQDPLKQFDEVNKCENIITDDPFVMHVAVYLRKNVEFLMHEVPTMKLEFFGKGCCHLVPEIFAGPDQPNS